MRRAKKGLAARWEEYRGEGRKKMGKIWCESDDVIDDKMTPFNLRRIFFTFIYFIYLFYFSESIFLTSIIFLSITLHLVGYKSLKSIFFLHLYNLTYLFYIPNLDVRIYFISSVLRFISLWAWRQNLIIFFFLSKPLVAFITKKKIIWKNKNEASLFSPYILMNIINS